MGLVGRYSAEVSDDTKAADLVAALGHLRGMPEAAGNKVAAMGYCLGGFLAYVLAIAGDPDACVSYYGSGTAARLDDADAIRCPTLFHFGGDDPFIPPSEVEAVQAAFEARDDVDVRVYPGAGHAFENFAAPVFHDPEASRASWEATTAFLDRTLRS
jgi:carboxymethylenebutenolidase